MTKRIRQLGFTAMTTLYVITVLALTAGALTTLSGAGMIRARREVPIAQAFQLAQACVDYEYQQLLETLEATHGIFPAYYRDLDDVPVTLPAGAEGGILVEPVGNGRSAWLTSEVSINGLGRSVRVLMRAKDVGIWNNAVFAGAGAAGQAINGNVDIRGSVHLLGDGEPFTDLNGNGVWDGAEQFTDLNGNGVWDPGEPFVDANGDGVRNPAEPYQDVNGNGRYDPPLTVTELNSSFSGNAHIGNNYIGMPSTLENRIPSIDPLAGIRSLGAEVRVKHGQIRLQGSATVGSSSTYSGWANLVNGTYVNDGWTGNPGSGGVHSENGYGQSYDLGNRVTFPYLSGIGAQSVNYSGTNYSNHQQYLNSNSLTINLNAVTANMAGVTFGPDANGNSFQWNPPSGGNPGRMVVNGIVRVNGNLTIGDKDDTIHYDGRGTLFATNIDVHANLLPVTGKIFPTQTALGLIASNNMGLATGNGDSQLSMVGAFYAQGTITSRKQNQIAGSFVATYYDMGTNVPNIYQVPELARNLPPGMPGSDPIISLTKRNWRERPLTAPQ